MIGLEKLDEVEAKFREREAGGNLILPRIHPNSARQSDSQSTFSSVSLSERDTDSVVINDTLNYGTFQVADDSRLVPLETPTWADYRYRPFLFLVYFLPHLAMFNSPFLLHNISSNTHEERWQLKLTLHCPLDIIPVDSLRSASSFLICIHLLVQYSSSF